MCFGCFTTIFGNEFENQLVNYTLEMQKRFHGLSLQELRSLTFPLATRNNVNNNFDKYLNLNDKSMS